MHLRRCGKPTLKAWRLDYKTDWLLLHEIMTSDNKAVSKLYLDVQIRLLVRCDLSFYVLCKTHGIPIQVPPTIFHETTDQ